MTWVHPVQLALESQHRPQNFNLPCQHHAPSPRAPSAMSTVYFEDHNDDSLLSCDLPALDADPNLECALRKISPSYNDLAQQYPWERDDMSFMESNPTESSFDTNLTDLFLNDHVNRVNLDAQDAPKGERPQYDAVSDHRLMDLSPRSVVEISTVPTCVSKRSSICVIRSTHSATAAAAAATAAIIVNDDRLPSSKRSSCSLLNSVLPKRPRIAEPCDAPDDSKPSSTCSLSDKADGRPMSSPLEPLSGSTMHSTTHGANQFLYIPKLNTETSDVADLTKEELSAKERARQCRAEALVRFRKKKAIRSFGRKVRYECRKRIATTRPRIRGKFAKKSDVAAIK